MKKLICLLLCGLFLLSSCAAPSSDEPKETNGKTAETVTAAPLPAADDTGSKTPEKSESYAGFRYEGAGFDTPEDAVLAYLAGLKNMDMEQMLGAFAWETQAEHYSYRDNIIRIRGTDPTIVPGMPFSGDLLVSANLEQMRSIQSTAIYQALETYLLRESSIFNSRTGFINLQDEAEVEAYFRQFDPERIRNLAAMNNIRFYSSDDVTGYNDLMEAGQEKRRKNYEKQTVQYGADEVRDIVVAFDAGDETLMAAPAVARYGDKWYLVSVSSVTNIMFGIAVYSQAFYSLPEKLREGLTAYTPYRNAPMPEDPYQPVRYEGDGFDTPEEAVTAYLEGFKNRNIQQMLNAFAWETQISRYSLKDAILRYKGIYSDLYPRMPSMDGSLDRANLESLRSRQAGMIYKAVRAYVLRKTQDADRILSMRLEIKTEEEADAFIRLYDNYRVAMPEQMTNIRAYAPEDIYPAYNNETVQEQTAIYQQIYGADELREMIGVADLPGETVVCNPYAARYGDRWYLVSVNGNAFYQLKVDANNQAFLTVDGTFEQLLLSLTPD